MAVVGLDVLLEQNPKKLNVKMVIKSLILAYFSIVGENVVPEQTDETQARSSGHARRLSRSKYTAVPGLPDCRSISAPRL